MPNDPTERLFAGVSAQMSAYDAILNDMGVKEPTDYSEERATGRYLAGLNQAAMLEDTIARFSSANRMQKFASAMVGDVAGYVKARDEKQSLKDVFTAQSQALLTQAVETGAQMGAATVSNAQQMYNQESQLKMAEQQANLRKAAILTDVERARASMMSSMLVAARGNAADARQQDKYRADWHLARERIKGLKDRRGSVENEIKQADEGMLQMDESVSEVQGKIAQLATQIHSIGNKQISEWVKSPYGIHPYPSTYPHGEVPENHPIRIAAERDPAAAKALQDWQALGAQIYQASSEKTALEQQVESLMTQRTHLEARRVDWTNELQSVDSTLINENATFIGLGLHTGILDPRGQWATQPFDYGSTGDEPY